QRGRRLDEVAVGRAKLDIPVDEAEAPLVFRRDVPVEDHLGAAGVAPKEIFIVVLVPLEIRLGPAEQAEAPWLVADAVGAVPTEDRGSLDPCQLNLAIDRAGA